MRHPLKKPLKTYPASVKPLTLQLDAADRDLVCQALHHYRDYLKRYCPESRVTKCRLDVLADIELRLGTAKVTSEP